MKAEQIRKYRESKGLTQTQFAELLGVSPTAVTTWEKGQEPSGPALKLLRFLIEEIHPFNGSVGHGKEFDLPLSLAEWEELERRRIRRGFPSVRDYIVWRMKEDAKQTDPLATKKK